MRIVGNGDYACGGATPEPVYRLTLRYSLQWRTRAERMESEQVPAEQQHGRDHFGVASEEDPARAELPPFKADSPAVAP